MDAVLFGPAWRLVGRGQRRDKIDTFDQVDVFEGDLFQLALQAQSLIVHLCASKTPTRRPLAFSPWLLILNPFLLCSTNGCHGFKLEGT